MEGSFKFIKGFPTPPKWMIEESNKKRVAPVNPVAASTPIYTSDKEQTPTPVPNVPKRSKGRPPNSKNVKGTKKQMPKGPRGRPKKNNDAKERLQSPIRPSSAPPNAIYKVCRPFDLGVCEYLFTSEMAAREAILRLEIMEYDACKNPQLAPIYKSWMECPELLDLEPRKKSKAEKME